MKIHRHTGAFIGAWCLGASFGGWYGAVGMAVFAILLLTFLERREKR